MNPTQKLNAYLEASAKAQECLQVASPISLAQLDIQLGLMDVLGIEDECELLALDLTWDDIVKLLKGYDFKRHHREVLMDIELEESIIPNGTVRLLLEAKIKHKGEKWTIYKNDADPFPSNPHAHNYESGLKLHLGNGALYLKNKVVNHISKKNLRLLRSKISRRNIKLPEMSI